MTIILLHFFGSSNREYAPVMNELTAKHTCIAPDLRGFGSATTAPDGNYSVDAMTDDVLELIRTQVQEPCIVVGHSMSGKVALNLASRRPEGLLGLVLLAPSPPSPEPIDNEERTRLLTTHGQQWAAEETLRKITAVPLSEAYQELIITDDLRASDEAWTAWLEKGSREDISDRMASVSVPIQLVLGSKDEHITTELMEKTVLTHFPEATLTVLDGAAHVLPLEKWAEVAQIVDTFATWLLSKPIPIPFEATKQTQPVG